MSEERDGNLGEVIDRRVQVYGDPVETFARIAEVWSGILGHTVNAVEVPLMMAGMKMVRAQVMPDYSDNSDDIDGYMDIFRKLVGEDMIHARTVNEFIEAKWGDGGKPYRCLYCDREFATEDDVNDHYMVTHGAEDRPHMGPHSEDEPIPYVVMGGLCPECRVKDHDTCGGDPIGCSCCRLTASQA